MEKISDLILSSPKEKDRKDVYLDKLLSALNEQRGKFPPLTYPRLQRMLKELGKSKKNWDRDIFIGEVLDRNMAAKYFWWKYNTERVAIKK